MVVVLAAVVVDGGWSMKDVLVVLKVGLPCLVLLVVELLVGAVGSGAVGWCCWGGRDANQVNECFHGIHG